MVEATALKNGKTFLLNNNPFVVVKYSHTKIARSGGNVKLAVRNLATGSAQEITLPSNTKVDEILTIKRRMQFLYSDGDTATFMDPRDFSQTEIPEKVLGESIKYISEGEEVDVLFWEERALSIDIPPKVTLLVISTPPGVKGNSASNAFKTAVLSNKLEVKVPLFIKNGDKVRVDTRTGVYVERVK